jgi:hypothetical protein
MNRNTQQLASAFVLAVAALAGGAAHAEAPLPQQDVFVSATSRAQVQAELAAFRQSGVNPWSWTYNPLRSFRSTADREQVVSGYLASRSQVAAFTAEDSGSAWLSQAAVRQVASDTLAAK